MKPDQLYQAGIQSPLFKSVKTSKYSASFQIFHQTGRFNGNDTCSTTNYCNFDFILNDLYEA